jgi:hypothetical protein
MSSKKNTEPEVEPLTWKESCALLTRHAMLRIKELEDEIADKKRKLDRAFAIIAAVPTASQTKDWVAMAAEWNASLHRRAARDAGRKWPDGSPASRAANTSCARNAASTWTRP